MLVGGEVGGVGAGGESAAPAGRGAVRRRRHPPQPSEFDDFLSEIAATVAQQVDAWRGKVTAAVLRWQGEGFRTAQLEALLAQEMVNDPERVLREFEEDVVRLQHMQAEAAALAPELAGSAAFRDPANLDAAEEALRQAREEGAPPPAPSPLWRLDDLVETAANRVVLEAVRAVAAEPGQPVQPARPRRRAGGRQDPPAARDRQRARRARRAGGVPQRAGVHRRADRGHRPRRDRRLAGALPPGDRVPARRRPPHRRQGPDAGRAVRALQRADRRRPAARVHVGGAAGRADRRRAAAALAPRGRAGGRAVRRPMPPCGSACCCAISSPSSARPTPSSRRTSPRAPPTPIRAAQALLQRVLEAASDKGVTPSAALRPRGDRRSGPGAGGAQASRRPLERPRRRRRERDPEPGEDGVGVARGGRARDRGVALMAIKGSLKEASLPDVIQLLFLGRRTGCLALADRHNFGTIYFEEGHIIYAAIVNRRDRLGDILVRSGRITQEQLQDADRGAGRRPRAQARRDPRRARRPAARGARELHPAADRGGGVLPVHLDLGDVQLRGGRPAGARGLPRPHQPRVPAARGRAAGGRVEPDREEDPVVRPDLLGGSGSHRRVGARRCRPSSSASCRCSTARATCRRSSRSPAWWSSRSGRRSTA